MDFLQLKDKLLLGEFDSLIGMIEDEHFDAKSGKYDFSREAGKQELAKDVSSFANRSGGIIVIGAKTKDDNPAFFGRRVESISLLPTSTINPTDYHNVMKEWIYPIPERIEADWALSKSDPTRGLFYIFIPAQPEDPRPFLITKDVDPATNLKRKEILFGYVERVSHSSNPASAKTIHTTLRHGRENRWREEVANRLAAIEFTLSEPPEDKERRKNLQGVVEKKVDVAIEAAGLGPYRAYGLAICPVDSSMVQAFLSSASDSIARKMEQPPVLRKNGWDMYTSGRADLVGGDLRRAKSDEYKILDLWRDGTLVCVLRGDESLLGHVFGRTRINSLTLIELTYMFFNFYELVLKKLKPPVNKLKAWWFFRNVHQDNEATALAPGPIDRIGGRGYNLFEAPSDSVLGEVELSAINFDAAKDSAKLLKDVYGWFRIDSDNIPYLTDDKSSVNLEIIKQITR
ncbi:MAG TPA: hypothetical protein VIS48_02835 [Candidatus Kryptonia bacterium]